MRNTNRNVQKRAAHRLPVRMAAFTMALIMLFSMLNVPVYAQGGSDAGQGPGVFGFSVDKDEAGQKDEPAAETAAETAPATTEAASESKTDAEAGPETESAGPGLKQQTLNAVITSDPSQVRLRSFSKKMAFSPVKSAAPSISLTGLLPDGGSVEAYPVNVNIPGQTVLAAFDITIYDAKGNVFRPEDPVNVNITDGSLDSAHTVSIYHMENKNAAAEYVADASAVCGSVTFSAEEFSVYAVVKTVLETTLEASDGNTYKITVSYDSDSGLPGEEDGASLDVSEILSESDLAEVTAAIDSKRAEGKKVAASRTFDIRILNAAGSEVQPLPGSDVQVTFELVEFGNPNLTADIYHMKQKDGSLQAQNLPVTAGTENTATVVTDGFSLYTVEFTYEGKQYVLDGGDIVRLDEVLEAIGITGTIEDAEVSDSTLFDVNWNKYDDHWYIWAEQPFQSEEWLKVTVDGVVYEIVVTDSWFPASGGSGKTGFASGAEIGTIAIADLANAARTVTCSDDCDWEKNDGYLGWTGNVGINETKTVSGSATVKYTGVATTSDGRVCDLEIVFSGATIYGSDDAATYANTGFHRIIDVRNGQLPIISAYTSRGKFGLKVNVEVNLYLTGTNTKPEGKFFATIYGVNQIRKGSSATHIVDYNTNNYYSETIEVDGSSADVYYNSDYLNRSGNRISPRTNPGAASYDTGIVICGDAQTGVSYTGYQFAPNKTGTNIELMPRGGINFIIESYSGMGGSIVTDTHGDGTGTVLPGGVVGDPRGYVIPAGKSVSYKMTPEAGYELKAVYIDGSAIQLNDQNLTNNGDGSYTYTFPAVGTTHKINVRWQMENDLELSLGHLGMEPDSNGGVTHVNLDGAVYSANPDHPRTTKLDKSGAVNKMGDLVAQPEYGAPEISGYTFFTYALGYAEEGIPSQFYAKSDDLALRLNDDNEVQYCVNYTDTSSTWETWSVKDSEGNPTVPKVYAVYTKDDTDTEHTIYATATAIARNTTDPGFVDPGMAIRFTEQITRYSYTISIDPARVTVDGDGKLTGGFTIEKTSEQKLVNDRHDHNPGQAHGHALCYTTGSETRAEGDNDVFTIDVYADNMSVQEDAPANYTLTNIVKKHGDRGVTSVAPDGTSGTFRFYAIGTSEHHDPVDTYEIVRKHDDLTGHYVYTVKAKNPASNIEVEFINTRETVELTLNELLEDERLNTHDFTVTLRGRELWADGREHFSMLGSHTLTATNGAATATGAATAIVTVPKNADILLIQRYGDTATTASDATVKITEYDTEVTSDPAGVYPYRPLAKEFMLPGVSEDTAVTFLNRLKPRIVTVRKNLIGGDLNISFEFTATVLDKNGDPWADKVMYTDDADIDHKTDADGKITFELSGNGSMDLPVPWHAAVTVAESAHDGVGETRVRVGTGAEEISSQAEVTKIAQNTEIVFTNVSDFSVMNPQDVVTYEFYLDNACTEKYEFTLDAVGDEPVVTHRQILRDQSVLQLPPQPEAPEGKIFKGWYRKSDDTQETGFGEKVTVDSINGGTTVKLYAVFADVAYAVFHNYPITEEIEGSNVNFRPVLKTVAVEKVGDAYTIDLGTVSGPAEVDPTKEFIGWAAAEADADNGTIITENYNAYPLTPGTATHFYPAAQTKVRVSFYTGEAGTGAPYIPSALINKGAAIGTALPAQDPSFTGYSFGGWYKTMDPETGEYSDQVTASSTDTVDADTTLYAKWNPAASSYSVAIWIQKTSAQTDGLFHAEDYDFYKAYRVSSTTDTQVTVTEAEIASHLSNAERTELNKFKHFNFAETKNVENDGTTIINAYYNRDVFTLKILPGNGYTGYKSSGTYYYETADTTGTLYGYVNGAYVQISRQQFGWLATRDAENHNNLAIEWVNGYPVYPMNDADGQPIRVYLGNRLIDRLPINSWSEGQTVYLDSGQLGTALGQIFAPRARVAAVPYYRFVDTNGNVYDGPVYKKSTETVVAVLTGLYEAPLPLQEYNNGDLQDIRKFGLDWVHYSYRYTASGNNNIESVSVYYWQPFLDDQYHASDTVSSDKKTAKIYARDAGDVTRYLENYKLPAGMKYTDYINDIANYAPAIVTTQTTNINDTPAPLIDNPSSRFTGYSTYMYRTLRGSSVSVPWSTVINRYNNNAYGRPDAVRFTKDGERYDRQYTNKWRVNSTQTFNATNPLHVQVVYAPTFQDVIFHPNGDSSAGTTYTLHAYTDNTMQYSWKDNETVNPDYTTYHNTLGQAAPLALNGNAIVAPPDKQQEGRTHFAGWYLDESYTDPFDPDTTVIAQTTHVYAKWEKPYYVVQVDPDGGVLTGGTDGGSTWFWVESNQTVDPYDNIITRDYDEYDGGKYYYHSQKYADYTNPDYTGGYAGYDWNHDDSVTISGSPAVPDGTYNLNSYTNPPHTATYDTDNSLPNDGKTYRLLPNMWKLVRWDYMWRNSNGIWPAQWQENYDFGSKITNHLRLKAVWEKAAALKIIYDPGDGTMQTEDTNTPFGGLYSLTEDENRYSVGATVIMKKTAVPNDPSLQFLGWKPVASTTNDIYPLGSEYIVKSQDADDTGMVITMVAQYAKLETTSLVYDANGGEGTLEDLETIVNDANRAAQEENPSRTVTMVADSAANTIHNIELNDKLKLSSGTGFVRSGYELVGWSRLNTITGDAEDTENGWTKYFNENGTVKDDAENKCFALSQDVTIDGATGNKLYAVWKRIPICKIGDTVYYTLQSAVAAAGSTATIQMLIDYVIPKDDCVTIPSGKNITFTTAATTGTTHPYTGSGTDGIGTLSRRNGFTDASLFTVENGGSLTFTNLTLDGNSVNSTASVNGGLVNNAGTLTLSTGATLTNSASTTNGGAVYSTGTVVLSNGAAVTGNGKGGAIYAESGDVQVSGNVQVYDNLDGSSQKNIVINDASTIQVTGPLSEYAKMGVYSADTEYTDAGKQFGTFTDSYNTNLDAFWNDVRAGVRGKKARTGNGVIWPEPTAILTVNKTVTGAMGDQTREFAFTLSGLEANTVVAYQMKQTTDGEIYTDGTSGEYTADSSGKFTFTLKHYQAVELTVPVDTELTLTEESVTGYKTWMETATALADAGKTLETIEQMSENTAKSKDVTLTEDEIIYVRNKLGSVSPTNVRLTYAPYALVLLCGVLLLVLLRRRRYNK